MISRWKVLECVASRYGDTQDAFVEAHHRLEDMRKNNESPIDLEDNEDRKRLRLAREGDTAKAFERIAGTVDFQDVYVFDLLSALSRSVCRITIGSRPIGTGFLVAKDIIITNHHVIENANDALQMFAEFDYEMVPPPGSGFVEKTIFQLNPAKFFLTSGLTKNPDNPGSGLDFTLIGLNSDSVSGKPLSSYIPVLLDGNSGKIIKGESCVIIQHPEGKPKKVVLKNTAFFSETESRLVYETDTLPGSSGAMVVALGTCEVIALHHAGLPRTDDKNQILTKTGALATSATPDDEIDWIGNEGIKISRIIQALGSAQLPPQMEPGRNSMLRRTQVIAGQLHDKVPGVNPVQPIIPVGQVPAQQAGRQKNESNMNNPSGDRQEPADFMVTAVNSPAIIRQIEAVLQVKYGTYARFQLAMPATATEDKIELYRLQIKINKSAEEEVKELIQIPGILNAEADIPLALNADTSLTQLTNRNNREVESGVIADDGFGKRNETDFIKKYSILNQSRYVFNRTPADYRQWNWEATGFNKIMNDAGTVSPTEKGIRIVQFDTGYSDHPKVSGGFDLDHDYNFLDGTDQSDARDPGRPGLFKQPGHGTRTGSLLIGNAETFIPDNGNAGLLAGYKYKLVPFRISESVILISRQHQLASALDMAISQGFDIISMSMGLPPTIATAKMARRAYEKGVIWCCAAGNEVQFVIAPAVFPGSIAVAASNPLDMEWTRSSRGDAVTITAPGEDVYVPILYKNEAGETRDGFSYGDGTSYATPHVAAAAAYWLARYKSTLNSPEYAGWKRVEAFREALKESARRADTLPTKGFGHGILDVEKLLNTPPKAAAELEFAYNDWNENAFFAVIQGYGELAKTFWNKLHGLFFGVKRGGQESLLPAGSGQTELSTQIETALFGNTLSAVESLNEPDLATTAERMNVLNHMIISSAKTNRNAY